MTILFLNLQIIRLNIRPHIKWAVSLVIAYGQTLIFLRNLCGYRMYGLIYSLYHLSPPRVVTTVRAFEYTKRCLISPSGYFMQESDRIMIWGILRKKYIRKKYITPGISMGKKLHTWRVSLLIVFFLDKGIIQNSISTMLTSI